MKILMVNDNDPNQIVGGSERYIADLTGELEAAGHRVHWFTLSTEAGTGAGVRIADFSHQPRPSRGREDEKRRTFAVAEASGHRWTLRHAVFYPALGRALRAYVKAVRPDVVHLHNNYRHPLTLLAATRGCRVVQTVHDYCIVYPTAYCAHDQSCAGRSVFVALRHGCMHWKLLLTEGWLLYGRRWLDRHFVQCFIAPNRHLAAALEQRLGGEVRTVPNFRSLPDVAASPVPQSATLLYVGALIAHKGVEVLLAAYKALAREYPDAALWLVGDGPDRPHLERSVAASALGRVRFWGTRSQRELADIYRQARLVVIPSLWLENAPLVAIEAMAHGRPVVASRVGGLPEMVGDGETGLLFERGNATDLAAKIRTLLLDHGMARKLGAGGRRRYVEFATPADHLDRVLAIYGALHHG